MLVNVADPSILIESLSERVCELKSEVASLRHKLARVETDDDIVRRFGDMDFDALRSAVAGLASSSRNTVYDVLGQFVDQLIKYKICQMAENEDDDESPFGVFEDEDEDNLTCFDFEDDD